MFRPLLLGLTALTLSASAQQPTLFEPNMGQLDQQVEFFSGTGNNQIFFTKEAANVNVNGDVIAFALPNGAKPEKIAGEGQVGTAAVRPVTSEANTAAKPVQFRDVRYVSAFNGVDLIYAAHGKGLTYQFEVAPNSNPSAIHLRVEGAQSVTVQPDGGLLVQTKSGTIHWARPFAYQEYLDKGKVAVLSKYVVKGNDVSFELGKFNKNGMLLIQPQSTAR